MLPSHVQRFVGLFCPGCYSNNAYQRMASFISKCCHFTGHKVTKAVADVTGRRSQLSVKVNEFLWLYGSEPLYVLMKH